MNDWMQDFIVEFEEDGKRYRTIWSGFTREDALREFQEVYPERMVIEGMVSDD